MYTWVLKDFDLCGCFFLYCVLNEYLYTSHTHSGIAISPSTRLTRDINTVKSVEEHNKWLKGSNSVNHAECKSAVTKLTVQHYICNAFARGLI